MNPRPTINGVLRNISASGGTTTRMLSEMVEAFHYMITGEDVLDGRKVWVLKTSPKPGYVPHSPEGRVLQHMQGQLWIDQATCQ